MKTQDEIEKRLRELDYLILQYELEADGAALPDDYICLIGEFRGLKWVLGIPT